MNTLRFIIHYRTIKLSNIPYSLNSKGSIRLKFIIQKRNSLFSQPTVYIVHQESNEMQTLILVLLVCMVTQIENKHQHRKGHQHQHGKNREVEQPNLNVDERTNCTCEYLSWATHIPIIYKYFVHSCIRVPCDLFHL